MIFAHGGVGTLLLSDLRGEPISRRHGQPIAGGGCYFAFDMASRALQHGWRYGMIVPGVIAIVAGLFLCWRLRDTPAAMGLPTRYAGDWARLQQVMRVDKKARGASLRFVVLDGLGNPTILTDPDQAWLDAAWAAVSETS